MVVLIERGVRMLSEGTKELMNLIRVGSTALHTDGELSTEDYNLLMNVAESILREHEGE